MAEHEDAFGAQWWERHYQQTEIGSGAQPSPYVRNAVAALSPGTVLEAGCGTGAEAIWLAAAGWEVTAVDISPTAIERAREAARRQAPGVAARITWQVADLTTWVPPQAYALVVSQYVHPDVSLGEFVRRLAAAVAPGGTLLVVGHDHADAHSSAHAPRDASMGITAVTAALDAQEWQVEVAETCRREVQHGASTVTLEDNVVRARRRNPG
jgi:SAM-dependent methyltransferase